VATVEKAEGIGGVFLRGRDAEGLRNWYAEQLGIDVHPEFGGAQLGPSGDGSVIWAMFAADTEYFGRPDQAFMVNYRVADLDAMLAQLRAAGVQVAAETQESPEGKFGWATDPEGNRFELWQPRAGQA
jgi:predicted enzyme related to lactoylglutathione lyase